MKLLVICPSMAPENTPRAYRWTPLVESLRARGHAVDVVCRPHPTAQDPPHVFRVPASWSSRPPTPAGASSGTARQSWSAPLSAAARWAWRMVRWPDYDCGFIAPAYRLATRLHEERRYDALVTVSHPFSSHLVGLQLKRRYPELPWLVDVGDPFATLTASPPNNLWLYGRKNLRAEAEVMHAADAASLTTISAVRSYVESFGLGEEHLQVIPPLYSLPTETGSGARGTLPPWDTSAPALRLVFIGRLYRTVRRPAGLLELFREVHRLSPADRPWQLHFIGNVDDCMADFESVQDLVGKAIVLHGEISRERADAARLHADVLVNIGNATPHQLPSKLVEYVASGKPVLNVVQHDDDTSREILDAYPRTLTLNPQRRPAVELAATLGEFLRNPPTELSAVELGRLCAPYGLPAVTDAYEALLRQAIESAGAIVPLTPRRRVA